MAKRIKRKIESRKVYYNPGSHKSRYVGGSIYLVLAECGHTQSRKLSQGVPASGVVYCPECESLRDGSRYRERIGDGPLIQWGWDVEKGLPTQTVVSPARDQNVDAAMRAQGDGD